MVAKFPLILAVLLLAMGVALLTWIVVQLAGFADSNDSQPQPQSAWSRRKWSFGQRTHRTDVDSTTNGEWEWTSENGGRIRASVVRARRSVEVHSSDLEFDAEKLRLRRRQWERALRSWAVSPDAATTHTTWRPTLPTSAEATTASHESRSGEMGREAKSAESGLVDNEREVVGNRHSHGNGHEAMKVGNGLLDNERVTYPAVPILGHSPSPHGQVEDRHSESLAEPKPKNDASYPIDFANPKSPASSPSQPHPRTPTAGEHPKPNPVDSMGRNPPAHHADEADDEAAFELGAANPFSASAHSLNGHSEHHRKEPPEKIKELAIMTTAEISVKPENSKSEPKIADSEPEPSRPPSKARQIIEKEISYPRPQKLDFPLEVVGNPRAQPPHESNVPLHTLFSTDPSARPTMTLRRPQRPEEANPQPSEINILAAKRPEAQSQSTESPQRSATPILSKSTARRPIQTIDFDSAPPSSREFHSTIPKLSNSETPKSSKTLDSDSSHQIQSEGHALRHPFKNSTTTKDSRPNQRSETIERDLLAQPPGPRMSGRVTAEPNSAAASKNGQIPTKSLLESKSTASAEIPQPHQQPKPKHSAEEFASGYSTEERLSVANARIVSPSAVAEKEQWAMRSSTRNPQSSEHRSEAEKQKSHRKDENLNDLAGHSAGSAETPSHRSHHNSAAGTPSRQSTSESPTHPVKLQKPAEESYVRARDETPKPVSWAKMWADRVVSAADEESVVDFMRNDGENSSADGVAADFERNNGVPRDRETTKRPTVAAPLPSASTSTAKPTTIDSRRPTMTLRRTKPVASVKPATSSTTATPTPKSVETKFGGNSAEEFGNTKIADRETQTESPKPLRKVETVHFSQDSDAEFTEKPKPPAETPKPTASAEPYPKASTRSPFPQRPNIENLITQIPELDSDSDSLLPAAEKATEVRPAAMPDDDAATTVSVESGTIRVAAPIEPDEPLNVIAYDFVDSAEFTKTPSPLAKIPIA